MDKHPQILALTRKNWMLLRTNRVLLLIQLVLPFLVAILINEAVQFGDIRKKPLWKGSAAILVTAVASMAPTYRYLCSYPSEEKNSKLKEALKIMGMSDAQYVLSYFLSEGAMVWVISFQMAVFLRIINVLATETFFTIWIAMSFYGLCLIGQGLAVSAFFDNHKWAQHVGFYVFMA
jgi:hypothetical protein